MSAALILVGAALLIVSGLNVVRFHLLRAAVIAAAGAVAIGIGAGFLS